MNTLQSILNALVEPWTRSTLEVYWPIIVQGMLVSVALGLIGCFLVVRGISLLGDALSHSVLPGIVIGFLIGGSLHSPWILVGATAMGMVAAVLIEYVHSRSRVKEDAALGIVFTALFALGVVMINRYAGQADLDPGCVLFGNIEAFILDPGAIVPMVVILSLIIVVLALFYRHLLVSSFDRNLATSLGIPAATIHYALMAVLSLTVVASFEAVGAILAVALLIMPGATARLWTDRLPLMLLISVFFGVIATLLGYWLSHPAVLDTSASGAISVAGFALFIASWLFSPHAGLVHQAMVRRRVRRAILTDHVLRAIDELGASARAGHAVEAELATGLRIPDKRVAKIVATAESRGLIVRTEGHLALTEKGQDRARRIAKAHGLWEQYLQKEVGLPADHVHDPADWIEHVLNEQQIERLDEQLKGPDA